MRSKNSRFTYILTYLLPQILADCGQTAADSDMVTIDSLLELANALSNGTIADPITTEHLATATLQADRQMTNCNNSLTILSIIIIIIIQHAPSVRSSACCQ